MPVLAALWCAGASCFAPGTLNYLSENGVGEFAELDVGLICDLRREDERAQEPTPESLSAARLEIPINPGSIEVLREKLAEQTFLSPNAFAS